MTREAWILIYAHTHLENGDQISRFKSCRCWGLTAHETLEHCQQNLLRLRPETETRRRKKNKKGDHTSALLWFSVKTPKLLQLQFYPHTHEVHGRTSLFEVLGCFFFLTHWFNRLRQAPDSRLFEVWRQTMQEWMPNKALKCALIIATEWRHSFNCTTSLCFCAKERRHLRTVNTFGL